MSLLDLLGTSSCPKCGSTNVVMGHFPLSCCVCGWHHLNEYPCDVCGKPSVSSIGAGGVDRNRCREHPFCLEDFESTIMQGFAKFDFTEWIKGGPPS